MLSCDIIFALPVQNSCTVAMSAVGPGNDVSSDGGNRAGWTGKPEAWITDIHT